MENKEPRPIPKLGWPERSCREPVWTEYQAYSCGLPELHKGPCASNSVRASLQRRDAWETAQQPPQEERSA